MMVKLASEIAQSDSTPTLSIIFVLVCFLPRRAQLFTEIGLPGIVEPRFNKGHITKSSV